MIKFKQYIEEGFRPQKDAIYHITTEYSLENIFDEGKILPPRHVNKVYRRGNFGTEMSKISKGRVHFTSDPNYWINQFTGYDPDMALAIFAMNPNKARSYKFKSTSELTHRKYDGVDITMYDNEDPSVDFFTTKAVPFRDLLIFDPMTERFTPIKKDWDMYIIDPQDMPYI